jgi:hypothetical protein
MIRFLVDHLGPVLVAVSLAAALISTTKWLLDRRQERQQQARHIEPTRDDEPGGAA